MCHLAQLHEWKQIEPQTDRVSSTGSSASTQLWLTEWTFSIAELLNSAEGYSNKTLSLVK